MRIVIHIPLLFFFVSVPFIMAKDDSANKANVENLKILRNSVNFAYKAGNNFLELIRGNSQPNKAINNFVIRIEDNRNFGLNDVLPMSLPYASLIGLTLAGLLFVIFVPIVGFCFCCCRCMGKCGGKIKGMDPKHATCKRYTYALFLGIISIVQLAGIVLAFINNQLIHDTLTNPSSEISAIVQLTQGTETLKMSLKNISEAIAASGKNMPSNSESKGIDSKTIERSICTGYMTVFKKKINDLSIDTNLSKIQAALNEVQAYLSDIGQNNDKLKGYGNAFDKEIKTLNIEKIRPNICEIVTASDLSIIMGQQIKTGSSTGAKLEYIVNAINTTTVSALTRVLRSFDEHVKQEYMEYRMYICIGVCCLLLLIVLFYFLGLCFGQCGERPFEDARICNRGVGANLMMAGVAFAFMFTPSIMIFEMCLFWIGGPAQTEVCRYISNIDQPNVRTLDNVLKIHPELRNNQLIKNNVLESIFNKCATESMADAFKVDDDLLSQDAIRAIGKIAAKIRTVPKETKSDIVNNYFMNIENLLSNITQEINRIRKTTGINNDVSKFISVQDSVTIMKTRMIDSFDAVIDHFNRMSVTNMKTMLKEVISSSYSNVKCDGIYKSARSISDAVCVTFLWPFNGFWFGVGICLIFTIPAIIFAVKLAGLYRRTEKYSSDYEEPDYHSYMGFYTNNADNIPMKRPKSAKSNNKNRNSNSNNKESLKQNNPQYLPVYPYDAYE